MVAPTERRLRQARESVIEEARKAEEQARKASVKKQKKAREMLRTIAPVEPQVSACPFCGGVEMEQVETSEVFLLCRDCNATGPTGVDFESALHQWNTRAGGILIFDKAVSL